MSDQDMRGFGQGVSVVRLAATPVSFQEGVQGFFEGAHMQYWRNRKGVKAYLRLCRTVDTKARKLETTLAIMEAAMVEEDGQAAIARRNALREAQKEIAPYLDYFALFTSQIERRILQGETIPQQEKVFSIFRPYTRWISKGKAGTPVELGVPVAIIEDWYQFVLGHVILWEGSDGDIAEELVIQVQKHVPELRITSFDRDFYSHNLRTRLDQLLDVTAMPKAGNMTKAERTRQPVAEFKEARRRHPGMESAMNNLNQRGLDRVRVVSKEEFERVVGTAVVAANIQCIGALERERERS